MSIINAYLFQQWWRPYVNYFLKKIYPYPLQRAVHHSDTNKDRLSLGTEYGCVLELEDRKWFNKLLKNVKAYSDLWFMFLVLSQR